MAYEFVSASCTIPMNSRDQKPCPADSWMRWPIGRWNGETLVVDNSGFNEQTWFDRAVHFYSYQLHVLEATRQPSPNSLQYDVPIEDPTVLTRP
jgi:hypothetical protein